MSLIQILLTLVTGLYSTEHHLLHPQASIYFQVSFSGCFLCENLCCLTLQDTKIITCCCSLGISSINEIGTLGTCLRLSGKLQACNPNRGNDYKIYFSRTLELIQNLTQEYPPSNVIFAIYFYVNQASPITSVCFSILIY